MPYHDDFEGYDVGRMARYSPTRAARSRWPSGPAAASACGRPWPGEESTGSISHAEPYTIIGSARWRSYEVACDARVEKAGHVALFGRIRSSLLSGSDPPHGYWLKVGTDGRWELKAFTRTLAAGTAPFAADRWHRLALASQGSRIVARIDGVEVKALDEDDLDFFDGGMAGLGSGWNTALFDNVSVREVIGPARPRPINLAAGKKATASSNYSDAYSARFASRRQSGHPLERRRGKRGRGVAGNRSWPADPLQPGRRAELDQRIETYRIQYWDTAPAGATPAAARPPTSRGRAFSLRAGARVRFFVVSTRNN